MPDITFDLPDELYDSLCEMATDFGISAEDLVRQMIALKVGFNPSSSATPISACFLRRLTDDVLAIANREPVHFVDLDKRKYVLISIDDYNQLKAS
ncbi:hypothetical protein [Ruegeria sp. A3M17]|uniref:hypothetical protein n=1 Tax=Ruegeria sp. A3M17 TaxID=2267229 RepID=UPI000DE8969B|nr:hypothetical protein [Ruegeria sp. A3M17]RBW54766.1 hypothetical protein DS906_14575 [Ruegeria sp. A3M17]